MRPTHLDLFSGIGGFALAAQWAGFQTIGFSEIEPYASAVLKKHWPKVPNYGDITKLQNPPPCDLLTGGFPCQPFSLAGKRRGKADDRYLWPYMLRAIQLSGPTWIIGENVAGFCGMELEQTAVDLENASYQVRPIIIPAVAVDAPHRRDRVWIVAHAKQGRQQAWGSRELLRSAQEGGNGFSNCGKVVADTKVECERKQANQADAVANARGTRHEFGQRGEFVANVAHSNQAGFFKKWRPVTKGSKHSALERCCRWPIEPAVGRVVNGLPNRSHRLAGLGNAIVPQVAYQILKAIREVEIANAEQQPGI